METEVGKAELVRYVMKFAAQVNREGKPGKLTQEEAECWLDCNCPFWRVIKRVELLGEE